MHQIHHYFSFRKCLNFFFLSKMAFEHLAVSGVPNVDFLHVAIRIIRFSYLVSISCILYIFIFFATDSLFTWKQIATSWISLLNQYFLDIIIQNE